MNKDLELFLEAERERIKAEKLRLAVSTTIRTPANQDADISAEEKEDTIYFCTNIDANKPTNTKNSMFSKQMQSSSEFDTISAAQNKVANIKTNPLPNAVETTHEIDGSYADTSTDAMELSTPDFVLAAQNVEFSKKSKELENQKESFTAKINKLAGEDVATELKEKLHPEKEKRSMDDKEPDCSDTFYSHFPSFSKEYQKRQYYLRDRQLQHQQNYLKHQMLQAQQKQISSVSQLQRTESRSMKNAESKTVSTSDTSTPKLTAMPTIPRSHDKTNLQIIVNNPGYTPPKNVTRSATTRQKLLQDLRHTELGSKGELENSQRRAEQESARKKIYQLELMKQIEEKQNSIAILHEKERKEEDALIRRLEEQLKSINLEEQLEQQKARIDKIRYAAESNRSVQEKSSAKLEDVTRYYNKNQESCLKDDSISAPQSQRSELTSVAAQNCNKANNDVYKYFSNSARHEYRRGKPMPPEVELDLMMPAGTIHENNCNTERACFNLGGKVCPMCDAALKSYENCCLRCQRKLSLKLQRKHRNRRNDDSFADCDRISSSAGNEGRTFCLVCCKCARLYAMCLKCLAKSDVCDSCHRKGNVCMDCRRALCSFCLEEVVCGSEDIVRSRADLKQSELGEKNITEQNKQSDAEKRAAYNNEIGIANSAELPTFKRIEKNSTEERAFQVLEVDYDASDEFHSPPVLSARSIKRNSPFHADNDASFITGAEAICGDVHLGNNSMEEQQLPSFRVKSPDNALSLERLRKENDKRLSRYLKNYGILTQSNRSTQTTPESAGRRDIVLYEDHNLSIPLLREMPKMTRSERYALQEDAAQNHANISNLRRRCEAPVVQNFSNTRNTSPSILAQLGTKCKEIQHEYLFKQNDADY